MDELENNKDIIKSEAFYKAEIKRGYVRGVKRGLLDTLFTKAKKDESGMDSTEKVIGWFKGHVSIENQEDHDEELEKREQFKNKFIDLIKEIYKKKFAKDLDEEMDLASLIESQEGLARIKNLFIKLKIYSEDLMSLFAESNKSISIRQ